MSKNEFTSPIHASIIIFGRQRRSSAHSLVMPALYKSRGPSKLLPDNFLHCRHRPQGGIDQPSSLSDRPDGEGSAQNIRAQDRTDGRLAQTAVFHGITLAFEADRERNPASLRRERKQPRQDRGPSARTPATVVLSRNAGRTSSWQISKEARPVPAWLKENGWSWRRLGRREKARRPTIGYRP